MRKLLGYVGLMFLVVAAARGATGQHTLAVTLNYDFTTDGTCSATVTKNCLQQFNIYDVTTGAPVKLFSINAPAGANGPVNGITGTSGQLSLKSGVHIFGATAQMADGTESNPNGSTATATTLLGSPASYSITVN
jgi:hypothetical protein